MNATRPILLSLCVLGVLAPSLGHAQELLPLDEATGHRLGLVFMRLAAPDAEGGTGLPARVVTSPQEQAAVVATHAGVLESWEVVPGASVAAGDLLGRLRSPDVLALQQDFLDARAEDTLKSAALQRDRQLFEDGVIAQSRLQLAEREAQAASSALQSAAAQLQGAGFDAAARAALAAAQTDLGFLRIVAPHAGQVAHLHAMPGTAVAAGAPLVAVTGTSLWVEAEIPARLASDLAVGQSLQVDGSSVPLQLRQRDQAIDPDTQTIGILAEFTAPAAVLPGQLVTLRLAAGSTGVLVPADAVVRTGDASVVYVRQPGGVEVRTLQLRVHGSDYLAESGVSAGEEVVVRGAALLKGIQLGLGGE